MILKASQRANGQNLAVHLMRADDNEHVQLYELRGFTGSNLKDAFKEAEAVSLGTKCKQYLFSVSLNPPEGTALSTEHFADTADRIERQLGLEGQPRALVIHEKEGRRHAHCVWSRIDAETMTAKQMSFFKSKLVGLSRDLYLENGWQLPRGLAQSGQKNPVNFTLAEWQHAKRIGIDPRAFKAVVQSAWSKSDGLKALTSALEERGLFLAKGDRRGFVLVDHQGEVHALSRVLGLKTKDLTARLGNADALRDVDGTKRHLSKMMTPALQAHIRDAKDRFQERSAKLGAYKEEMTRHHRKAREEIENKQKSEWDTETLNRAARLPKGLRGLWSRLTGKYQIIRAENEAEAKATQARQAQERQRLIEEQMRQRSVLQERIRDLRHKQAETLLDLRADIGRYLKLSGEMRGQSIGQSLGLSLKLNRN
jgi:hypothetical protein